MGYIDNLGGVDASVEGESILPLQLINPQTRMSGPMRLALAVVITSYDDFIKYANKSGRRNQRLAEESYEWFMAEDSDWPFSFVNLCNCIGLEESRIRNHLKTLKAKSQEDTTA